MKKTIGYIRVSTKKQEQFGGSIEAQKELITRYCEMYHLHLVGFLEDASSAKAIKSRPAMMQLLEQCRADDVDAVVSCKIDRMFRNTIEGLQTADEFAAMGKSLFFVEMGGLAADVTTARGRRIFAYDLIDAECERMRVGERTKAVLGHKRDTGQQHSFHAPYGWKYNKAKQRMPHPAEQEALKRIWELHYLSKLGNTDIAKAMSASRFKTQKGRQIWAQSTIRSILSNPVNTDLFALWAKEEGTNQHAANHTADDVDDATLQSKEVSHV